MAQPSSEVQPFCLHFAGQNSATQLPTAVRGAGECSQLMPRRKETRVLSIRD